jgi:hypothetical protein
VAFGGPGDSEGTVLCNQAGDIIGRIQVHFTGWKRQEMSVRGVLIDQVLCACTIFEPGEGGKENRGEQRGYAEATPIATGNDLALGKAVCLGQPRDDVGRDVWLVTQQEHSAGGGWVCGENPAEPDADR